MKQELEKIVFIFLNSENKTILKNTMLLLDKGSETELTHPLRHPDFFYHLHRII
jgi:hypothetical protein